MSGSHAARPAVSSRPARRTRAPRPARRTVIVPSKAQQLAVLSATREEVIDDIEAVEQAQSSEAPALRGHRAERVTRSSKHHSHRSDRPSSAKRSARPASATPRRTSGRARALLALGSVAALGTGLSAQGTMALWTDQATMQTGSFSSGTLDITLGGNLAGISNNGGTWNNTSFALDAMQPGESSAASFVVANVGSTPLTYTVGGTGTGTLAVANGMRYSLTFGTTATNSGTAAAGTRAGSCGTTATDANTTVLTTTSTTVATARTLAVNTSETVCIVARLSASADNTLQGKTSTAAFLFDSKQTTTS